MKQKIMIVDDNHEIIDMVKEGFEHFSDDYELTGADSGKECFEILKTGEKPDLIILDIIMPKMSGWEVFAKLKENPNWREIPIVFLTAKTDPYSKGFGMIPADDYIEKPFGLNDLKKRIDKILNK
jgi:CheY-like chemotaxis protein